MDKSTRDTFERLIHAQQQNNDRLSGDAKSNADVFNRMVEKFEEELNTLLGYVTELEDRIAALEP